MARIPQPLKVVTGLRKAIQSRTDELNALIKEVTQELLTAQASRPDVNPQPELFVGQGVAIDMSHIDYLIRLMVGIEKTGDLKTAIDMWYGPMGVTDDLFNSDTTANTIDPSGEFSDLLYDKIYDYAKGRYHT